MEWRKPQLICVLTKDLLCKVKAKADSYPKCLHNEYAEEHNWILPIHGVMEAM